MLIGTGFVFFVETKKKTAGTSVSRTERVSIAGWLCVVVAVVTQRGTDCGALFPVGGWGGVRRWRDGSGGGGGGGVIHYHLHENI